MPDSQRERYRQGEVLVKYRDRADSKSARELRSRLGLTSRGTLLDDRHEALELPAMTDVEATLPLLRREAVIAYAEPNYLRFKRAVTPNDPDFGDQWGLKNTGQAVGGGPVGPAGGDLHMPDAWAITTGDGSVTVAIVDDGVLLTHPDLSANLVTGRTFTTGNGPNGSGNGSNGTTANDHGTLVAGCIGAVGNNGIGVAGPAWNVKLMPLKFDFSIAGEVHALDYAIAKGARIVNGSFGGPDFSQSELDAINRLEAADILFVVAAGNEDSNTDVAQRAYPANYDAPNVVAVGATNQLDEIASFSTYGPTTVDVAAPGRQIVTTRVNGGYSTPPNDVDGTSFASPYVAGVAALLDMHEHEVNNDFLHYGEIKARLIEGADPGCGDPTQASFCENSDPTPDTHRTVGGRVNAARSLGLSPQPSIIIQPADGVVFSAPLNSGTTPSVDVTLENDWIDATSVVGTLHASTDPAMLDNGDVTVTSGSTSAVTLNNGATTVAHFDLSVANGLTHHKYVYFTLHIAATGYSTDRHFIGEIGQLLDATPAIQAIGADIYDEFQTWTFDVPPDTGSVTFQTTASNDIDILVKLGAPAEYQITLGCTSQCVYVTDVPSRCTSHVGCTATGNEQVTLNHPAPGTYYVTVVDYSQQSQSYTLEAKTGAAIPSGGGGGAASLSSVLLLSLAGLFRRRRATPAA